MKHAIVFKRFWLITAVLMASAACAQIPDARILSYVDSALLHIRMTRSDMAMHWDSYPDDPYRLQAIKHFFEDPLSTFNYADVLAHKLEDDIGSPKSLIADVAAPIDIVLPNYTTLRRRISAAEIQTRFNVNLELFSPNLRAALTELLTGIVEADTLVKQARAVYTPEEFQFLTEQADSLLRENKEDEKASLVELKHEEVYGDSIAQQFLKLAKRFPRELICEASAILLQSVNAARIHIARMTPYERDTVRSIIFHSAYGAIAIGGTGNDTYEGRYGCILDLGGNDVYRQPASDKASALAQRVSVTLDYSGDDLYTGDDFTIASGFFGVSILEDDAGNDVYHGGSFSIASGMFGAGILIDREGNDQYSGGTFVEGAGGFGFGVLMDLQGNDTYVAQLHSQGFGFTWGLGVIVEMSGNDTYTAAGTFTDVLRYDDHFETLSQGCGLGIRPFASGGIGLIAETSGNDTYVCDIFGQGAGYWFAFGAIVDDAGNDHYMSYQYAQGAGIHLAFGVLLDKDGTDYYNAHGVSMGCGHDIGFGGLLDLHGDDYYTTEGLSLGGGNANAVSFFCDAEGNDAYSCKAPNTFGYSDNRRGYGMIGVFLDLGGNDVYPTSNEKNNSTWTGSYFGVGMDVNIPDTAKIAKQARQQSDDSVRAAHDLAKDIRTLFLQASAAPQKYQYLVEPARKALIDRKQESIPYLLTRLNATSPRERLALTEMLPKMGHEIIPALLDSIHSSEERVVNMSLYVLGKISDSADAEKVLPLLSSPNWRVRMNTAEQLGLMKNTIADSMLWIAAMKDTVDMVRMRATGALGVLQDDSRPKEWIDALSDASQLVRNKAREAFDSLGEVAIDAAYDVFPDSKSFAHEYLAEILVNNIDEKRVYKMMPDMLSDNVVAVRSIAVGALEKRANKRDIKLIRSRLHKEKNPELLKRVRALAVKVNMKLKH